MKKPWRKALEYFARQIILRKSQKATLRRIESRASRRGHQTTRMTPTSRPYFWEVTGWDQFTPGQINPRQRSFEFHRR